MKIKIRKENKLSTLWIAALCLLSACIGGTDYNYEVNANGDAICKAKQLDLYVRIMDSNGGGFNDGYGNYNYGYNSNDAYSNNRNQRSSNVSDECEELRKYESADCAVDCSENMGSLDREYCPSRDGEVVPVSDALRLCEESGGNRNGNAYYNRGY